MQTTVPSTPIPHNELPVTALHGIHGRNDPGDLPRQAGQERVAQPPGYGTVEPMTRIGDHVYLTPDRRVDDVRTYPDPSLRRTASHVDDFDATTAALAARLEAVVVLHNALGVAAPQIGVNARMVAWSVAGEHDVIVNPVVVDVSRKTRTFTEACLSVPGVAVDVVRPCRATVTGFDIHGTPLVIEDDDLVARVLQHEIDHLNGILMIDHGEPETTVSARRILDARR